MKILTEFFLRNETVREQLALPAQLVNRCLLSLTRSPTTNIVVPVRNMQLQAVIDQDEQIYRFTSKLRSQINTA